MKVAKTLIWSLLFGLVFRLAYIHIPIFEVLSAHQEKYAMIARNFYYNGFNIFYPALDYIDVAFDKVFLKLHLFSFFSSVFYLFFGKANIVSARILAIVFSIASAYFIYRLASDIYDKRTGIFSSLIFFLSPAAIIYTRVFLPISLELFFLSGVILFSYRWIYHEKKKYRIYLVIFMSVLLLMNYIYIVFYLPIFYLAINKYKNFNTMRYIMLPFLFLVLWLVLRVHLYGLNIAQLFSAFASNSSFDIILSSKFWIKFTERIIGITLTPIGFFFLIRGLFINRSDLNKFVLSWFLAGIAGLFLWNELFFNEKQYYLILLAVSSVLIGKEIAKVDLGFKSARSGSFYWLLKVIFFIAIITQISAAYTYSNSYNYVIRASSDLNKFALETDKIIVSTKLYYYNRKGWALDFTKHSDDEIIVQFNDYKKQGAKYLVVSNIDSYRKHRKFLEYILDNCKELVVAKGYRIYKL